MARATFVTYLLDNAGNTISGASVAVREPDTETLISETVFAADSPDMTELGNQFTADADGRCEIWLDVPKVVDLFVQKTGFDPVTIRAIVHSLTSSTLTVLEAGTPLPQRAGINFGQGFDLADDAVEDETDISIDLTEVNTFTDHSARHEDGGADEISIAGLAGTPAALTTHESTFDHAKLDANEAAIAAHEADAAGAHAATAISNAPAGDIAATTVQAAINELDTDKASQADLDTDEAALAAHIADGPDGHEAFPVGSIFMSAVATNPATLLGYGTWSAFGAGRVPVGLNAADADFDTLLEEGGTKTHVHAEAVHAHGAGALDIGTDHPVFARGRSDGTLDTATTGGHTINGNTANSAADDTGASSSLQPYIVVHMWRRTA